MFPRVLPFLLGFSLLVGTAPLAQAQTASAATTSSTAADAILGDWLTENGRARVRVQKTKSGKYVGTIVWLKEPLNEQGQPKLDKNNPDETKRTRPILSLRNVNGIVYEGENTWGGGTIYDPESGNDYSVTIKLVDAKTLEVRGYIGVSVFGRTTVWTR